MQLLKGDPWPELFGQCRREAFHLELRDTYAVPTESEPLRKYLAGEPDDHAWFQPWSDLMRATTDRGVAVTRLRVVTDPDCDYQRWLLALAELNTDAGEDIRYLARQDAGNDVPGDDFWLFDDDRVVFNLFDADGRSTGTAALSTDPVVIRRCRWAKNHLWPSATPYVQYVADRAVNSHK
ncbi:hypothetical protein A5780_19125 [Nocardia sp. 852002-20019_SCH5090214]|uniref:DUF6879 family protein n=1 Tax=Nocardia sp. 852002-20019_SCH5090214 TaxID=1834087 RepID=UPI0007EA8A67|nr:DUF6879 family protein [Nocardia sp. 852002-20019_SCH5090214]OBA62173.1 hypothetical protein A5780_19125 [Nocardia sp. 852002-20019_SCH5090214]